MEAQDSVPAQQVGASWDILATELSLLRRQVGNPSYEKVAQLVADRRVARGSSTHAARIARSTVYDCFRTGRTRINVPLVREIALALGSTDAVVDQWLARCHHPVPSEEPGVEQATVEPQTDEPSLVKVAVFLTLCVALNLAGRFLVDALSLPGYFDMVGTAVAAVALGPWQGALVGASTNVLGVASSGTDSLYFVPVNVVGALVWGYGVHRFGMGRSLQRYFALNMLTGLACTAVAVPVLVTVFGGLTGNGTDVITQTVHHLTGSGVLAISVSNTLVSQADKLVSGFVALVVVASLPPDLRRSRGPLFDAGPTGADPAGD